MNLNQPDSTAEKPAVMKKTIVKLAVTAMFAALISAGAFVAFPIGPVPIALQNFFTLLAGMVMGPVLGPAAVALFIAAGAVGLPVFANNGSPMGIARILGPSGGYLAGYLLGAFAAGLIMGFPLAGKKTPLWKIIIAVTAGVLVVYIPGMLRLKMFLNADWEKTLAAGLYPFIAGDIAKGVLAGVIAPRLRRVTGDLFSA